MENFIFKSNFPDPLVMCFIRKTFLVDDMRKEYI